MDPITLILTALAQGAAKAATDVVPDAYKGLPDLLRQRFAGQPTAEMVLEEPAADAVTDEAPLRKQLEQASLADDPRVLALPRALVEQAGTAATPGMEIGRGGKGIIGQTVTGATIIGDLH